MDAKAKKELQLAAAKVRLGAVTAVYSAKSGHPGGSLSAADTMTYLYMKEMNVDPQNPRWAGRDRLVLSKGHTCPGLYAALAQRGFFPVEELKTFRKPHSRLQGHPDMKACPGVDMTTGSLGQGLSAAVGMALAGKFDSASYRVFAVLGDGELQEGQIWEAAMLAGHHKLDNLIAVVDNNNLQIDGCVDEICSPHPIDDKFSAFGWHVICIDGHDFDQIEAAFAEARTVKDKPVAIIQKTFKGMGVSYMHDNVAWHGAAPNDEQFEIAKKELSDVIAALEG